MNHKQNPFIFICYISFAFSIGAFLAGLNTSFPVLFGVAISLITLFYMRQIFNGKFINQKTFNNTQVLLLSLFLTSYFLGGMSPAFFNNNTIPFGMHVSGFVAVAAFLSLIIGGVKGLFTNINIKQHALWLLQKIAYGYAGLFLIYWVNLESQQIDFPVLVTVINYITIGLLTIGTYFFITYLVSGFITYLFHQHPHIVELPVTQKIKRKFKHSTDRIDPSF